MDNALHYRKCKDGGFCWCRGGKKPNDYPVTALTVDVQFMSVEYATMLLEKAGRDLVTWALHPDTCNGGELMRRKIEAVRDALDDLEMAKKST